MESTSCKLLGSMPEPFEKCDLQDDIPRIAASVASLCTDSGLTPDPSWSLNKMLCHLVDSETCKCKACTSILQVLPWPQRSVKGTIEVQKHPRLDVTV